MERRHSSRIKAGFPVTYNLKSEKNQAHSGTVLDLNRLGMRVVLPQSLPKETVLDLKFEMNSSGPMLAHGVVVWQYEADPTAGVRKGYLTGIQFSRVQDINPDHITGAVGRTEPTQVDGFRKKTCLAKITYTASYLPKEIVTNKDIIKMGLKSPEIAIRRGLGAIERRSAGRGESTADMIVEAARAILAKAGRHPSTLDLIICAVNPSVAVAPDVGSMVQEKIGAHCPAFEINMSCSGWLCALDIARRYIASGSRAILVMAASAIGSKLPIKSLMHRAIFGDGAGGALLESDPPEGGEILACELWTRGEYGSDIYAPLPWTVTPLNASESYEDYFRMNPDKNTFFKVMDYHMIPFINRTLSRANVSLEDIDIAFLHYPTKFLFDHSVKLLKFPQRKVIHNFDRYGNLVCAEMPVLLDESLRDGKVKKGDLVLMFTYGAGFTGGCAVIKL